MSDFYRIMHACIIHMYFCSTPYLFRSRVQNMWCYTSVGIFLSFSVLSLSMAHAFGRVGQLCKKPRMTASANLYYIWCERGLLHYSDREDRTWWSSASHRCFIVRYPWVLFSVSKADIQICLSTLYVFTCRTDPSLCKSKFTVQLIWLESLAV
jgi:hypothetical protein